MSLFKKYNDNKAGSTVSGSVLPRNTLFNDTGLIQSVSRPDVVAGRAESSLFKKRQETDAKRIEKFIKSPAGQNHASKEIGFARSNPVFLPNKGILGDNPSRIINPRKVVTNTQYAGSGVFNDKFGLINIFQDDGYSKYFKSDNSKLRYLYDNVVSNNLKPELQLFTVPSEPKPGFLNRFLTVVNNISRVAGFRAPSTTLYEYPGGPGSNNGIGLTTIYRYETLDNKPFYADKNNFYAYKERTKDPNYKKNIFWEKPIGLNGLETGNIEKRDNVERPSRFLAFATGPDDPDNRILNPDFTSQFTSSFGQSKRFIYTSFGSPVSSNEYLEGKTKPGISDYYVTKPIKLWDNEYKSLSLNNTKSIASYSSQKTGSLNASFVSASTSTPPTVDPDLIDFKLEIIDLNNDSGANSYYLHFKAFIDSFTDDFKANYDTIAYPGNPSGKLYKYQSFDRNINLTFKVAVFSKGELSNIYRKLNRLASTTLPTISPTDGSVRSTITKLTVGNWCKRLPGVVSGITFQNLVENPWDIDEDVPQILTINLSYLYSSTYEDTNPRTFVTSRPDIGTTLFGPP